MSRFVINHCENIWRGHIKLDRINATQKYFDGQEKHIKREIITVPDSIAVLLYRNDNENFILTSQWRAPIVARGDQHSMIEVCAGNIDPSDYDKNQGDNVAVAKKTVFREVKEETGWHIHHLYYLFALYSSPGISTEKLYYFIACVDEQKDQGGGLREEGEDIDLIEWDMMTTINAIKKNKIVDLKTVLLIEYFKNNKQLFLNH